MSRRSRKKGRWPSRFFNFADLNISEPGTAATVAAESAFLSEEVKTMLYLTGVKSFDVTEVRTSGLFNLVLCRQAGHGFLSASIRLLINR